MENPKKSHHEYSIEDILAELGINTLAEITEHEMNENGIENPNGKDEIDILRKKIRRLEKENVFLHEKVSETENHTLIAMQQNFMLREEIRLAFIEMARREERTIEKNVLPFQGVNSKQYVRMHIKTPEFKELCKEKKVSGFNYPMSVEYSKWRPN